MANKFLFLTVVWICPLISWGQDVFSEMLKLRQRPSILEVARNSSSLKIPLGVETQDELLQQIEKKLPYLIATLESYFPNGQYFFMGRDVALVGEALELFYRSIGQTDRVRYLNLSSSSFYGAKESMIEKFLEQNSMFTLDRPIVIVDSTTFRDANRVGSGQSQAKRILNIIRFRHLLRNVATAKSVRNTQVVTLMESPRSEAPSWKAHSLLNRKNSQREAFFLASERSAQNWGQEKALSAGFSIKDYSIAWHQKFQPLRIDDSGEVVSDPGELEDIVFRQEVLASMKRLAEMIVDRAYIEKVLKEVKTLIGRQFLFKISAYRDLKHPSCRQL